MNLRRVSAKRKRPAARKRYLKKSGQKKNGSRVLLLLALVALGVILLPLYFKISRATYWNNDSKLLIASVDKDNVFVYVLDPINNEVLKIVLPNDMEVEVARQLGVRRLGSVWELGKQEKLEGELLTGTLIRHLNISVFLWSDNSTESYIYGNFAKALISSFYPHKTNIPIGDRIKIALFAARTTNKQGVVNLADTSYLKKENLKDGNDGYKVVGQFPKQVITAISYPEYTNSVVNVRVEDVTGRPGIAVSVAALVNNLGGKVASVMSGEKEDFDCEIWGTNLEAISVLAKVLQCEVVERKYGLDVNLKIGSGFARRY
jgi:hypothetical protein